MLLEILGVTKSFGGLKAVDDVSLGVEKGEILGLIGPNGAGKTTLFNIITGSFGKPDGGKIGFDGRNITGHSPHRLCHIGLVRTWQVVKPFLDMTVLDNVIVGALAKTSSIGEAREKAKVILEVIGLGPKKRMFASALTIADRKMLEVARALATDPVLLMLDEPMAGLNEKEIGEFVSLVKGIREKDVTIFVIEHVMSGLMPLVDRIVVLSEGKKIAEGKPREIAADEKVIKAYLGEEYVHADA